MKKFFVVLEYELMNYLKNKSYMITTILVALIAGLLMFLPNIIDLGIGEDDTPVSGGWEQDSDADASDSADAECMLLYDKNGVFSDMSVLQMVFGGVRWEKADSVEALKEKIEARDADAGFAVDSLNSFEYFVYNQSMMDMNQSLFEQALGVMGQMKYCEENGLDYEQVYNIFAPEIDARVTVLGKNMANNYWYCYGLVIVIFMIIISYGVMVATSVTQEKSNRTIEVLMTSTDPNSLFFGKVIAGAIAALLQSGIVLGIILGAYKLNQDAWGGMLDMVFDIPGNVLLTFAFFGLGGFLFYTFIYGAMGALVSKTEDINKAAGGIQMIIMIVYFAVLIQLMDVDGIVIKAASFLPISSYSAMFARVAMGTVAAWEIVLSFVILAVSTAVVGIIGSKIYRMGTLRYGNPIKLSSALKNLRQGN